MDDTLGTRDIAFPEHNVTEEAIRITKDVLDNQELDDVDRNNSICYDNNSAGKPKFDITKHVNIQGCWAYFIQGEGGVNTKVSEKNKLVQWRGQHFKCKVLVELDSALPEFDWTIGLAQACDNMLLENRFGQDGTYKWEFHPMKAGRYKMVNDSNGSQWPFYSHRTAMLDLAKNKPTTGKVYEFKFSDYFYPTMHWEVNYLNKSSYLSEIERRQSFTIWMIAIRRGRNHITDGAYSKYEHYDPEQDTLYVLKTMKWRYNVKLRFDANKPLGSRCVQIEDAQERKPEVLDSVEEIPTSALVAPNCNSCQSLLWYPKNSQNELVLRKEPDDIIVPWKDWMQDMTKGYGRTRGFERPDPPPRLFPYYKSDPILQSHKIG